MSDDIFFVPYNFKGVFEGSDKVCIQVQVRVEFGPHIDRRTGTQG